MNVARVSEFTLSMLLAASSAFSLTCSPLSYQLATDTLSAKWAAPFNLMVQAHKVTVLARYCANNVLGAKLSIDGVDLKKPECSEVWFYEQELPDHFHLPKYKD